MENGMKLGLDWYTWGVSLVSRRSLGGGSSITTPVASLCWRKPLNSFVSPTRLWRELRRDRKTAMQLIRQLEFRYSLARAFGRGRLYSAWIAVTK